ncbi:PREDICTED: gamma-glutamyltransferase 7-like, partial [Papilio xuthus]|uniref:Gamma-glutamyltransferase 7-like n=1 Tax=Papilio xuthus TaxID=66420 RepID=A0AAJ7EIL0_PAPXU
MALAAAALSERIDNPPPGAVELREDVPLQGGGEARPGCAGPRLIAAAFAALSAAVTLALLTQIYYGDYEVVPHGSVSASVPACSAGGARLLRAGGGALDAAAAAALCLAAAAPHRLAALDASGSLLYWDYRRQHEAAPTLAEWGAAGAVGAGGAAARAWDAQPARPPRLLAALAALHAQLGRLPWSRLLQPAIDYAESLATDEPAATTEAAGAAPGGGAAPGAAVVAQLLRSVQYNSSRGVCCLRYYSGELICSEGRRVRRTTRMHVAVRQAGAVISPANGVSTDTAASAAVTGGAAVAGVAGGWRRDPPGPPLDLAPALIADQHVCGSRYVIGAGSTAALAATARALAAGAPPAAAVEAA